jgi:hypothetical protein
VEGEDEMALTAAEQKVIDEVVALLPDEKDKTEMRRLYETQEPVRAHVLRQSEFDRQLNAAKVAREKEQQELADVRTRMAGWQKTWDDATKIFGRDWEKRAGQMKTELEELPKSRTRVKDLEDQIAAAAAAGSGNLTDAATVTKLVSDYVAGRPFVTKDDLQELVKQAANVIADERAQHFYDKDLPGAMEFIMTVQDLQFNHQKEFGTSFNRHEFHKFSKEHDIADPQKAYNEWVAKQREDAKDKQRREDIEKDLRSKMGIPGEGVVLPPPASSRVMEILSRPPGAPAAAGSNGHGVTPPPALQQEIRSASIEAAAELRAEGKG